MTPGVTTPWPLPCAHTPVNAPGPISGTQSRPVGAATAFPTTRNFRDRRRRQPSLELVDGNCSVWRGAAAASAPLVRRRSRSTGRSRRRCCRRGPCVGGRCARRATRPLLGVAPERQGVTRSPPPMRLVQPAATDLGSWTRLLHRSRRPGPRETHRTVSAPVSRRGAAAATRAAPATSAMVPSCGWMTASGRSAISRDLPSHGSVELEADVALALQGEHPVVVRAGADVCRPLPADPRVAGQGDWG